MSGVARVIWNVAAVMHRSGGASLQQDNLTSPCHRGALKSLHELLRFELRRVRCSVRDCGGRGRAHLFAKCKGARVQGCGRKELLNF